MIRSSKRWIVAVVRGDNNEILRRNLLDKTTEPLIELDKRLRISGDIPAMPEDHVEVDEVHEDQSLVGCRPEVVDLVHAVAVRIYRMRLTDSFVRKNVADLPDADHRE